MADDLQLSISFDASPAVDGLQKVATAAEEMASSLTSSFGQVETASVDIDTAFKGIGSSIASSTAPSEEAISNIGVSIGNMLSQFGATSDELISLSSGFAQVGEAIQSVIPAEVGFGNALDATFEALINTSGELTEGGTAQRLYASGVDIASESELRFAAALDNLPAALIEEGESAGLAAKNTSLLGIASNQAANQVEHLLGPIGQVTAVAEEASTQADQLKASFSGIAAGAGADELAASIEQTGTVLTATSNTAIQTGNTLTELGGKLGITASEVGKLEAAMDNLLGPLAAVGEAASTLPTQLSLFDSATRAAIASSNQFDGAISNLASIVPEAASSFNGLVQGINNTTEALDPVLAVMAGVASEAVTASQGLLNFGASAAEAGSGLSEMQEAQTAEATNLAAMSEELAMMAQAQTGAAEATSNLNTVTAESATSLQAAANLLESLGTASAAAISNIRNLATSSASAALGQEDIAVAVELANKALAKLGSQLVESAEGYQLVSASAKAATTSISQVGGGAVSAGAGLSAMGGLIAYVGGRSAGLLLGLGQLSFAFGILSRQLATTSAALAPLLIGLAAVAIPLVLAEAISTLSDKYQKLQDEIRKSGVELDDLAATQLRSAEATQVQNLRLEDEINKLEGRPTANRLAEALLQASIAAQNLNKQLSDAIEKETELLEKGQIGIFRGIVTGDVQTIDFQDKIKETKDAYTNALSEQIVAENNFTADASEENKKRLADAKQATADRLQDAINAARKERDTLVGNREKERTAPTLVSAPDSGVVTEIPKTEGDTKAVDAAWAPVLKQANSYVTTLLAAQLQIKANIQATEDEEAAVVARNAAEARARARTEEQPEVRGLQDRIAAEESTAKEAAKRRLEAEKTAIQDGVDAEIAGGKSKEQAQLDFVDRTKTALVEYQKAFDDAVGHAAERFKNELAPLKQKIIIETEVGADKTAGLKTSTIDLANELNTANSQILDQDQKTQDQLAAEDNRGTALRTAIAKKSAEAIVNEEKQKTSELVALAKESIATEAQAIKSQTEEELRIVQEKEQLKLLTSQQALDQRVAILNEEQSALDSAIANQIASLSEERDQVLALQNTLTASGAPVEVINQLNKVYEELTNAINRAAEAHENLNTKVEQAKVDAAIKQWREYQQAIADFVNQSTGEFNRFVGEIFTGNKSIAQDFYQLTLQLENNFIQMILRMIEQTKAFQAIESSIQGVLDKIFNIKEPKVPIQVQSNPTPVPEVQAPQGIPGVTGSVPGAAANTGAEAAANAQKVAANAQTNAKILVQDQTAEAQKTAIYSQDQVKYAATQTEKTSVTAAQNASQTGIVGTAQATQTTATDVAQTSQTGAVTVAKGEQLAVTASSTTAGVAIQEAGDDESRLSAAKTAAANTYKSVSAIPVIGWILAPVAAAAAFAATLAFVGGGMVEGAGTGTSDSIPAMLSHGEFVVKADAVSKPGVLELLHNINTGRGFADGGLVSDTPVSDLEFNNAFARELSINNSSVTSLAPESLSADARDIVASSSKDTSFGPNYQTPSSDTFASDGIRSQFDNLSSLLTGSSLSNNSTFDVLRKSLNAMISSIPSQDRTLSSSIKNQFSAVSGALTNNTTNSNFALNVLNKSLNNIIASSSTTDSRQLISSINSRFASVSGLAPSAPLSTRINQAISKPSSIVSNTNNTVGNPSNVTNLTFNQGDVHALDGKGAGEVLGRNQGEIAKIVTGLVRRGAIDPRKFFR